MRIYLFAAISALAVSLAPAGEAVAAPAETQAYNRGNALYAEGKYDEALAAYGAVTIESPDVEYNRGAVYYKKGDLGRAALHFHRALRLRPGDADALANIAHINALAGLEGKGSGEPDGFLRRALNALPLDVTVWSAVGLYWIGALCGVAAILSFGKRDVRRKALGVLAASALAAAMMTAAAGWRVYQFERNDLAVVVDGPAPAHPEPSEKTEAAFTIPEGARVTAGRVEGNYLFVTLVSGYSGWVGRESVERI